MLGAIICVIICVRFIEREALNIGEFIKSGVCLLLQYLCPFENQVRCTVNLMYFAKTVHNPKRIGWHTFCHQFWSPYAMGPPGGPKHEYGSSKTSPGPGKNRNKVFSNLQHFSIHLLDASALWKSLLQTGVLTWHSVERPRFENGGTYDACFQSRALRSCTLLTKFLLSSSTIQLAKLHLFVSMPTSRTRTSDDEQIAAEIRAMREACEAGGFPLSRETTRGFVTPRNQPPPASLTNRPARTASPLRVATGEPGVSPSQYTAAAPTRPAWARRHSLCRRSG